MELGVGLAHKAGNGRSVLFLGNWSYDFRHWLREDLRFWDLEYLPPWALFPASSALQIVCIDSQQTDDIHRDCSTRCGFCMTRTTVV